MEQCYEHIFITVSQVALLSSIKPISSSFSLKCTLDSLQHSDLPVPNAESSSILYASFFSNSKLFLIGTASITATYATSAIFGVLFTPICLRKLGPKVCLILCEFTYLVYILANAYAGEMISLKPHLHGQRFCVRFCDENGSGKVAFTQRRFWWW